MALTRRTTLAEVIQAAVDSGHSDHYHILPAYVINYYPATCEADLQIAITDPRFDPQTDELSNEQWPPYPRVRVAWPKMGGFVIVGHLQPGDAVQVFFQDLDDSAYRTTSQVSDPPRTRRFGADGAFCLPFAVTDSKIPLDATPAAAGLVVGQDGGVGQTLYLPASIDHGGRGAGVPLALAPPVVSAYGAISVFAAGIATAIAAGVAGATPGDGGAAALTAMGTSFAAFLTALQTAMTTAEGSTPAAVVKGA